jgi:hypothetical protein
MKSHFESRRRQALGRARGVWLLPLLFVVVSIASSWFVHPLASQDVISPVAAATPPLPWSGDPSVPDASSVKLPDDDPSPDRVATTF